MEEVSKHEQLFVLMDANARTGRREKGQVGSKDSKILGAYGRDTLNDNGELLLSFANNHDLALVNTFFSTPKGGVSHTFNGRGKTRIDYILTRQRDHKFVRNVTVHPQPSFLPISDHNIVSAPVKLLGHFARNRRLRASAKKSPVDRRRPVTDPQLRQEVATAVGRHLRANPPGDSSVDDVEAAFAAVIMRTAEMVIPPQERRIPGRGWSGDARTEAELQAATDAMHTAWQRLRMDTRDAQLRRAVRKACNWLKRCEVQQSFVSSSATSLSWRNNCAWGISTDSSKTSNRCNWRRQRRWNHSASVTRKEDCCATKGASARGG